MRARIVIAIAIVSFRLVDYSAGAVPDRLVPRWPDTGLPDYHTVLDRKLSLTPADCGRLLVLPSPASQGEEAVSIWSNGSRHRITYTKASRNIWYAEMSPKDPDYHGPVRIFRADADIPASTALAIRRAWTEMLRRTASTGYHTERVPIHPTEYEFSLRDGAQTRIGTVIDALSGKRTSELIGVAHLLIDYCRSDDIKRGHIAREIEHKATRLASRFSDIRQ
jgi:hypothetical protein